MIVPIGSYLAGAYCIDYIDNPSFIIDEDNDRLICFDSSMNDDFSNDTEEDLYKKAQDILNNDKIKKIILYPNESYVHLCYKAFGSYAIGTFDINYTDYSLDFIFKDDKNNDYLKQIYLDDILAIGECDNKLFNLSWFEINIRYANDYKYYTNDKDLLRFKDSKVEKLDENYNWQWAKQVEDENELLSLFTDFREISLINILRNIRKELIKDPIKFEQLKNKFEEAKAKLEENQEHVNNQRKVLDKVIQEIIDTKDQFEYYFVDNSNVLTIDKINSNKDVFVIQGWHNRLDKYIWISYGRSLPNNQYKKRKYTYTKIPIDEVISLLNKDFEEWKNKELKQYEDIVYSYDVF